MLDAGRGSSLAVEPVGGAPVCLVLRIAGQMGLFDGDVALHEFVHGTPHGAHAAGAEAFGQPVATVDQTSRVSTHVP